jgi:hypothetical protein
LTKYTKSWHDVLRPDISVPGLYLSFLVLALLSYLIEDTSAHLAAPSFAGFGASLLAIVLLIIFIKTGRGFTVSSFLILVMLVPVVILDLYLIALPIFVIIPMAGGYAVLLWFLNKKLDEHDILFSITLLLAIGASVVVLLKGIPLQDMALRQSMAVNPVRAIFHGSSVIAATLSILFYKKKIYVPAVALLAILALLLGFKSDSVAVLLSAGIAGLLTGKIRTKGTLIILAGVVFILTVVGTYMAAMTWALADNVWDLATPLYIVYRAGFTLSVFDEIVNIAFPYGITYGKVLLSPSQEIMGLEIFEYKHIITSTLVGPGTLDFGIFGLILTCAFVGTSLGMLYKLKNRMHICFYSIALAHTFIIIEVGLQLTSILWYLSLLYLSKSTKNES